MAFCLNQSFPAQVEAQSMMYSQTRKPTLLDGKFANLTVKNEENPSGIAELGKTISISNSGVSLVLKVVGDFRMYRYFLRLD